MVYLPGDGANGSGDVREGDIDEEPGNGLDLGVGWADYSGRGAERVTSACTRGEGTGSQVSQIALKKRDPPSPRAAVGFFMRFFAGVGGRVSLNFLAVSCRWLDVC